MNKNLVVCLASATLVFGIATSIGVSNKYSIKASAGEAQSGVWYYRGTVNGADHWNDFEYGFTHISAEYYHTLTIDLKAGDQFKLDYGGDWESNTLDGGNVSGYNWVWFSGGSDQNVSVKCDGTYTFEIWDDGDIKSVTATNVDYSGTTVHISGNPVGSWEIIDGGKFTDNTATKGTFDWSGSFEKNNEFKLVIDGKNWAGGGVMYDNLNDTFTGTGEANMVTQIAGHYDLTFNPNTCKLSFDIDKDYYYVEVNGTDKYDLEYKPYNNQFEITHLALNADDEILININGTAYGYSQLQNDKVYGSCVSMFEEGTSNAIRIKSASEYEFYYKTSKAIPANVIWAQIDSEIEASNYATLFKAAFVCDSNGVSEPSFNIKEGETRWSWALLETEYGKLTNGAKDILYEAGASLDAGEYKTNIADAIARYDWIVSNHGYTKFVKNGSDETRNVAPVASAYYGNNIAVNHNSETTGWYFVLAATGFAAVAGTFFLLRKRNEN